ncbi:MAG: sulfatase-like hydrolase/transferase, partial [Acidobacteriota bacterium]
MTRRLAGFLFVAVVGTAALWLWRGERAGIVPQTGGSRPNIVLITVDTLRADRLRRGFTPSMDALADRGLRFDNARTAVPLTLPSHVTIMTGARPAIHGVHVNGVAYTPGPPTLARVLHQNGYSTAAFVGAYVLNHVFGLADGFDTYDDRVHRDPGRGTQLESERRGGEVVDAALEWLRTARPPYFLWVHLYDPHAPYDPPAEFLARAGGRAYDGEVAYADAQVGRILDAVNREAIVALAGDHGEGLGEHGEETHGMLAYDSTLRVPLVLVQPGTGRAGIVQSTVSLEDLAGAILRSAGVPSGIALRDGASSIADPVSVRAETEYPRVAGWHPLAVLVDERWKLILSSEPELYDIGTDSGERRNLAGSKTSLVDAMSRRLHELATPAAAPAKAPVPADAAERLRALGYVSGSASAARDSSTAENPARVIGSWTRFEHALSDLVNGQAALALPALRDLAERFPAAPVFESTYARALNETGSSRAALAIYKAAVARWPEDAALYHDLAIAARAAGDTTEALRA